MVDTLLNVREHYFVSVFLWAANILMYLSAFFSSFMYDYVGLAYAVFLLTIFVRFMVIAVIQKRKGISGSGVFTLSELPGPLRAVLIGSFAVTILNFLIHTNFFLKEGGPQILDGVYWITNHGKKIRSITEREYLRLCMAEARMFLGHLILFNGICVTYFGNEYANEKH